MILTVSCHTETLLLMLICCFRRWGTGEPNGGTNANCVETQGSLWNDHDCCENRKWICERKILI